MIYSRPTKIKIKLNNLLHNLSIIKKLTPKSQIMAVVKSNAYGHGSIKVASTLNMNGVNFFAVACAYEAEKLFKSGLNAEILSLGKIYREDIELAQHYRYTLTISSIDDITNIQSGDSRVSVHLKVDTGMGRCGVWEKNLKEIIHLIKNSSKINLKGVITHFPAADTDIDFTNKQIENFKFIKKLFYDNDYKNLLFHCANSDAIINFDNSIFDFVRPGLMLYGAYGDIAKKRDLGLKPVMEFVSKIVDIKSFNKGDSIGYGRSYIVTKDYQKFGLIPVGYADGFSRFFSNKGVVLTNGKISKIAGRVSMDWSMIELEGDNSKVGDDVILFGDDNNIMDVDLIAKTIGTISYEILCNVGQNYRKEIVYLNSD